MKYLEKHAAVFIVSILFTILSLFFHGYSFGIGDHSIHLPIIEKFIDSSLYPNDIFFLARQGDYSLFYPSVGLLSHLFNGKIELLFFVLYTLINFLFYAVLILLGQKFFHNMLGSLIFVAFFIYPFHIGGSAIQSIEISLVPRFAAFTLSILTIYFVLNYRYISAFILAFLVFAIHPITFIYLGMILGTYIFISKQIPLKVLVVFSALSISLLGISASITHGIFLTSLNQLDFSQWIHILRERNSYAFLDLWSWRAWFSIGVISIVLLIGSVYRIKNNPKYHLFILSIFIASVGLLIIQYIFTTLYPIPTIIILQLSRIWIFGYLAACLVVTRIILSFNQRISLGILLLIFALLFYQKSSPVYKKQNSNWIDAQVWIQNHTSKNCVVLTPFDHQGFRIYSKRTIVSEYKDGTLSFYSQPFSKEWDNRRKDIEGWEKLSPFELEKIAGKYNISLLVAENRYHVPLSTLYSNSQYSIYARNALKLNCKIN